MFKEGGMQFGDVCDAEVRRQCEFGHGGRLVGLCSPALTAPAART
jgi:hypothetical protein